MTAAVTPVRRALVSVSDKAGLAELAAGLHALGVEIVSTGSTAAAIRAAGVPAVDVSDVTGFPEIMDGRVKTLHPAVHAAILADRSQPAHVATLAEHGIAPIDLVVCSLYPFASDPSIELIDIGGPTMIRAAAKNHAHVGVVVDPTDYPNLLEHLRTDGGLTAASRRELAAKAFAWITAYDAAITDWFSDIGQFPPLLTATYRKAQDLRYGENPHQAAAYYVVVDQPWGIGSATQLHGKELSYNNLLDADAAWGMAVDFDDPCVVIVKHTNPAGLAVADRLADAYPRALAGDPVSAFGGIVAVNRTVDAATAAQIAEVFTEVVVAPGYDEDALTVLRAKANLRLLDVGQPDCGAAWSARTITGGLLVQTADLQAEDHATWTVASRAQPDAATMLELRFAWRVAKHVKSNAIVLTHDRAVVGVGAGQMSRVDSVRLAVDKSAGRAAGSVLASDAFFPFADGPEAAIAAGVAAIVQPGGSVRDHEVVAVCDAAGIPLVLTGRRHFRH